MNTYPALQQSTDSKETRETGRQLDRASNGSPKVRVLFSAQKKSFSVVHPALTDVEKATLEAFVSVNSLLSFYFVWKADGVTYTCKFGGSDPDYSQLPGGRWRVTVPMVEA